MSEEKGLMSKALEDVVKSGLDRLINTKGVVEMASDLAIDVLVPVIDNNVADRIRDDVKLPLREAGDLMLEGKYLEAAEKAGEVVANTLDVPGMDESDEQRIARKLTNLMADIIATELKNKK